jgi:Mrp family chromosome partitioning ATPase/uncharacterized protein involved in exopolysaccharide biosynthesis
MDGEKKRVLGGKPGKPFDPVGTFTRHWLKILVFGTVLFILLAPFSFIMSKPYYTAMGKLRVAPVVPSFLAQTQEKSITDYFEDYISTQVDRIKEIDILKEAINKLPPELRSIYVPGKIPISLAVDILDKRLNVMHVMGTHLIILNISGEKPEGLAEIINNVIMIYLDKLQKEEEGKNNRRLAYLMEEQKRLEQRFHEYSLRFQDLINKTGTSNFSETYNIMSKRLSQLQAVFVRTFSNRVDKESILKGVVKEAEEIKKIPIDPYVEEMIFNNNALWDMDTYTYRELQKMRATLDGVTKNNPDRKYVEIRMKGMENYLSRMKEDVRRRTIEIIRKKRDAELQKKILKARTEYETAVKAENALRKEIEIVKKKTAELSQLLIEGRFLEEKIKHTRNLLNRVDERIQELKLEARAPVRISLETPARYPDRPAGTNLKKLLMMFFAVAFGSVAFVAVVFDIMDNRIRSVRDVANAIGAMPSWPISNYLLTGRADVPFHRVTMDDPTNVVAKAIRSLAIKLDKERKEHDAKIVVFTGVDAVSGVTGIICNTAHAMTRLCGRVIVIDANLTSPYLHNIIEGGERRKTLLDLLTTDVSVDECIIHDSERGHDFIVIGRTPTEEEIARLDKARFIGLIESLRSKYDFIIVDAPPILISDFTEFLMVHTDIAALVIQGDRSLYKATRAAAEFLVKLEVPAVAAVLNWGAPRYKTKVQELISKTLTDLQGETTRERGDYGRSG